MSENYIEKSLNVLLFLFFFLILLTIVIDNWLFCQIFPRESRIVSTRIRNFFFPQIFLCGYENFRVHTQRIQMVWCPIVSGNEHAHNCDFGVISSPP